jgi:hypothetical protein
VRIDADQRSYCPCLARGLMSTFCVVGTSGALSGVDKSIVGLGSEFMPPQPLSGEIKAQPTSPTIARTKSLRTIQFPPKPAGSNACEREFQSLNRMATTAELTHRAKIPRSTRNRLRSPTKFKLAAGSCATHNNMTKPSRLVK